MKKLLIIFSAGFIFLLSSCNSKKEGGGMSDKAKKNLEVNAAITKMIESGDMSKIGDYIAADAVDHGDMGDVKGLDSIKATLVKYSQQSEDMKSEAIKEFADDDYVMGWYNYSGKMKVDQMGMKAGDSYKMMGIEVSKYKDGKAIEHWMFMQPSEMMKMMPPPPPPVKDSL
jgi:predicted SnoaL-like aldol condensation-catalyzing enzyme